MTTSVSATARTATIISPLETVPQAVRAGYFATTMSARSLSRVDIARWDRLAGEAIEDNPFVAPQFVFAGRDAFADMADMQVVAIRSRENGELVGLFPFSRQRLGPLLPEIAARSTLNIYQVQGTPLVSRDHANQVLETFLLWLRANNDVPARWVFPHVNLEGGFAQVLTFVADVVDFETHSARAYSRPALLRDPAGFDHHVETVIGKKRRKDIERNLRRLGELGQVRFERVRQTDLVKKRVEAFLELEQSGWKGQAGTSMLSQPDHAKFARAAFGGGQGRQIASVDSLLLDDKPIAVSINIGAGRTLFTPKCAYDETYRKYGPGMVLEYKVIKAFYADPDYDRMDAATTEDGHVISSFWNQTVPMGTLVLGPKNMITGMIAAFEDAEYQARKFAKRLLKRQG